MFELRPEGRKAEIQGREEEKEQVCQSDERGRGWKTSVLEGMVENLGRVYNESI